jgi:hypothetical protein
MALLRRQVEKVCGTRIVALDAAAVGVHPAEVELRLGIAGTGAVAIEPGRPRGVFRHPFAMLESQRLLAQREQPLGFRFRWLPPAASAAEDSAAKLSRPPRTP